MKKILAFIMITAICLSLVACGNKYKPVESTAQERQTVYTMSIDGKEYKVAYELYRAFFLQYKSSVDDGDGSVWSGEKKDEYVAKINETIFSRIADIYAVFHACSEVGIDVYSDVVEETIEDYITVSIEGGSIDDMSFAGFDGDYGAYLAHLKENYMNYSVQALLYRYSIAYILLEDYYADKVTGEENVSYTREDVKAYYDSEECVRVLEAFLNTTTATDKLINTPERAKRLRDGISKQQDEWDAGTYMIANTLSSEALRDGMVIGKYSLDPAYYASLTEAAFSLGIGETSEVIEIVTGLSNGYYILYRAQKSEEHFEKCYEDIEASYILNTIGGVVSSRAEALKNSITTTEALIGLDYAGISMG
jgi:hypothetical protein